MTDNEIIKALGLCTQDHCYARECPIFEGTSSVDCRAELIKKCNDLINRQKAEIERLEKYSKKCFDAREKIVDDTKKHYEGLYQTAKETVRNEAITEFAERLKEKQWSAHTTFGVREFVEVIVIDQIAEEMKGGNQE